MKKLELNVPESLSEITLKQYQKFIEVSNNNTDDAFVAQKMIEIFCNVSLANVVQMKVTSIMELNEHFRKVFNVKPKFKNRFTIDGIEFGFIPNIEEITFEEYVDIEHYLKDIKDLHKALAILYRPIKKKQKDLYEIESKEYGERFSEVLRYAPLDVVIPAKVFFWSLANELLKIMPSYLEKEMKKLKRTSHQKDNLAESGDGITQLFHSQMEILQSLTKSLDKDYENALHWLVIK